MSNPIVTWLGTAAHNSWDYTKGTVHGIEANFTSGKVATAYKFPDAFSEARNFRDVGVSAASAKTIDGKTLKPGMLMRMDAPTETDLAFYKAHGVRWEIDLRSSGETQWENMRGNAPSWRGRASTPVTTVHLPIDTIPSDHAYDVGADDRDIAYAKTMQIIATHPGQPLLVHCTHGADRTGMCIAVIMMTLGYSRAAAKEEYLRTTAAADQGSVSSDNFDDAMDDIVDRYGSFAGYLSHLHDLVPAFDASTVAKLKATLLR